MPEAHDEYGAYDLSWWDTLQIFQQLMPLVSYAQRALNEPDTYKKGIVVADALEWLASRSKTHVDDEVVKLLGDVVKTAEGERLIRYILSKVPQ
jgi:hypothetical protein